MTEDKMVRQCHTVDTVDMGLGRLQETIEDRWALHAVVRGFAKSQARLSY